MSTGPLDAADDRLGPAWSATLQLAWASFCAGTTPVGAVVLDGSLEIVASGRGRRFEEHAPPGQLAGTHVAHAELNALAMLAIGPGRRDHVLLTSLEPCLMCHGAAIQSTIGQLCFAAPDPYAGTSSFEVPTLQAARRSLRQDGPLVDERGALAALLHLAWLLERPSASHVVDAHRAVMPEFCDFVDASTDELGAARAADSYTVACEIARGAPLCELAGASAPRRR